MSESLIILRGFEPANLAQEVLMVVGEAVSLTQRTDIGQACANLLEVAGQCLNQEQEPPPEPVQRSKFGEFPPELLQAARRELEVMVEVCREENDPEVDKSVGLFLSIWEILYGHLRR